MPESVIIASQVLDDVLNQYERGDASEEEVENKRAELYKELKSWEDSREDRKWW